MNQITYLQQREGESIPELAKRIAEAHQAMRTKQPEIISRAEAKSQGLKYYFTGNPCKRGHIDKRFVVNWTCYSCSLEDNIRYHDENHEDVLERRRIHYQENQDVCIARSRIWREENHYAVLERERMYREKNREFRRNNSARWRKENHSRSRAHESKRRAAKRQAIPSWYSEFDEFVFQQAYELAALRQQETGIEWHIDHMIPLRARKCCGLHCADNIQVIPAEMNLEKSNKMQLTKPLEWLK